jgi:hypothetical protein
LTGKSAQAVGLGSLQPVVRAQDLDGVDGRVATPFQRSGRGDLGVIHGPPAVEAQVRVIRRQLGLPPPENS